MSSSINAPVVRAVLSSPPAQVTPSPADWRDVLIYFVMVDRFNNPHAPPRNLPFDAEFGKFQGGTIAGMQAQLPYLKRLGVGAIWFTPVLFNGQLLNGAPNEGTFHGYGIQDFISIDPRFASNSGAPEQELLAFVQAAHAQGIYVIFDIVLNHTGDVFQYPDFATDPNFDRGSRAPFSNSDRAIRWRDANGNPSAFTDGSAQPPANADLFPDELRKNEFFRRRGQAGPVETEGDFSSLKQFLTRDSRLGDILITCYQYLIAKFDIDGLRIDTLKYLDPNFALAFGNAMREFCLGIGKKNFFTFGEVYDDDRRIAEFIGRGAAADGDVVGVDAALDFPLFFLLPSVAKGLTAPRALVNLYRARKEIERGVVSSHGEASRYFVTFLDNHDQRSRFRFDNAAFDAQVQLGLACLMSLPGIPCLYYGTEQGLSGAGGSDSAVREALWGKVSAFDQNSLFYRTIQQLAAVRAAEPALRYGRFYFRQLSGDGVHFGISDFPGGVLAFSRILNRREVLLIANASTSSTFAGQVIIDASLHASPSNLSVLYSNLGPTSPAAVSTTGPAQIQEIDGSISAGPARVVSVRLAPMQVLILG
jgi:glycosidase